MPKIQGAVSSPPGYQACTARATALPMCQTRVHLSTVALWSRCRVERTRTNPSFTTFVDSGLHDHLHAPA